MSFRDLLREFLEGEVLSSVLEQAIFDRLVSSDLVPCDREGNPSASDERKARAVAERLVTEFVSGELERFYDGIGSFHGWFERAALLRFVDLEPLNDDEFSVAIVDGLERIAEVFREQYAAALGGYFLSKCDPEDNRSKDRATEIGTELVNDCISGFISKYGAKGSLEGWLRIVGRNRLKTWWEKEKIYDYESEAEANEAGFAPDPEEEEEVLIEAVRYGFTSLKLMFPMRLVIVRLVWLFNIPQRRIAAMYRMDEAEISRLKKYGLESLRTEITGYLATRFPKHDFSWEQIISFIARFSQLAMDEDEEVVGIEEEKGDGQDATEGVKEGSDDESDQNDGSEK